MYLSNYGRIVNECWQKIPDHFPQIVLHEYVIMPNHVHGIIEMQNNTDTNIVNESIVGAAVGANTTGMCADTTGMGAAIRTFINERSNAFCSPALCGKRIFLYSFFSSRRESIR